MVLMRNKKNYLSIIIKYSSYQELWVRVFNIEFVILAGRTCHGDYHEK